MRRDPYAQVTLDVGNKTAARAVARAQCLKLHRNAPIVGTRNLGPRRQIARRDCALCLKSKGGEGIPHGCRFSRCAALGTILDVEALG
jgi:hypothetical protein